MNSRTQSLALSGIVTVICLAAGGMADIVYADTAADVIVLRAEMDTMKRQFAMMKDANAELQKRVATLEDRINFQPPSQPTMTAGAVSEVACPTSEIAKISKKTEISVLEQYSKQSALDATAILQKVPDYIPNYFTKGLEFHGYFRSGYGVNGKGGMMQAFQAPGAPAKFRLGNEQETYIESILVNNNWNPDPEGITVKTQLRMAYQTNQNNVTWDPINDRVYPAEMFGEMGNIIPGHPDIKVWAGERFYRLPELDIIDFWWSDMSGYGGGFSDIDLFNNAAKLNIAYIGYSPNDVSLSTSRGRLAKNNIHIMFHDFEVPGGVGTFWVNGGYIKGGNTTDLTPNVKYPDMAGINVGFMHYIPGELNNNQLGLQYGCGANTSLSAGGNMPMTDDDRKSWRVRITEMFNRQITDKLCVQIDGVYQYTDSGRDTKCRETWISLGARPIYMFNKHFGLEFEPGVDYINNPLNGYDTCLYKVTGALRVAPAPIWNSRPEFRIFATYATWGDDFRGQVGGPGYETQTEGWNYGIQCENWW